MRPCARPANPSPCTVRLRRHRRIATTGSHLREGLGSISESKKSRFIAARTTSTWPWPCERMTSNASSIGASRLFLSTCRIASACSIVRPESLATVHFTTRAPLRTLSRRAPEPLQIRRVFRCRSRCRLARILSATCCATSCCTPTNAWPTRNRHAVEWSRVLKVLLAAKVLIIGVLVPTSTDHFVRLILRVLQVGEPRHQPHR